MATPADAVVEVRDLVKRFGPLEAVRGISFDVAHGEAFGFIGPNGAGKSTTISILCTLLRPTSGTARVAGFDVVRDPLAVRRRIGLVFQDPTLDEYLTAEENLRFHARLYGVPRRQLARRLDEVLDMVELGDRRHHLVRTFSGGMKRRLEIARGLMHSPQVLFLDEPTIGLDPQTRSHIWSSIDELRAREQVTMFLTTHSMEEAERCDRVAIIDHGELVATGTPEALKETVGQDRIELHVDDPREALAELRARYGIAASRHDGEVAFQVARADEFAPRLLAELRTPTRAIHIARPTLDDVFMAYTGRTIRDAEASSAERRHSGTIARAWRGRR
ncbi:MAG TPA: ATP-binding cassette domain-containing protein [Baekduia sp.]|nr:ATP-binding cassette domain-containing protein [Baekduia sp.]